MEFNLKKLPLELKQTDKGHIHLLNGKQVCGCTSISKLFEEDGWKFAWPPKLAVEYIKERWGENLPYNREYIDTTLQEGKNAWRKKRDKSADTGTLAHQWCEVYIKGKLDGYEKETILLGHTLPIDEEILSCVIKFLDWESKNKVEWLASEVQVGSLKYNFAGILDWCAIVNGIETLGDIKTSKDIKFSSYIKTAGLWICLEEQSWIPKQRMILHLPKESNKDYEARIVPTNIEKDKEAFITGVLFYNQLNLFKGRSEGKKRFYV